MPFVWTPSDDPKLKPQPAFWMSWTALWAAGAVWLPWAWARFICLVMACGAGGQLAIENESWRARERFRKGQR